MSNLKTLKEKRFIKALTKELKKEFPELTASQIKEICEKTLEFVK